MTALKAALEALDRLRNQFARSEAHFDDIRTIRTALSAPADGEQMDLVGISEEQMRAMMVEKFGPTGLPPADAAERKRAAAAVYSVGTMLLDRGERAEACFTAARLLRSPAPSPASPAAEPVAWRFPDEEDDGHWYIIDGAKRPPGTEYIAGWEPLYAAPPAQEGAREGWVLVPVEPTPDMSSIGGSVELPNVLLKLPDLERLSVGMTNAAAIYRAMLAAAPKPTEE